MLFRSKQRIADDVIAIDDLNDTQLEKYVGENYAKQLREDTNLIEGVYEPFDMNLYREGYLAPVFFGSAINNFGVKELLDTFVKIAPFPLSRTADVRQVSPEENNFSGFVFKIHANLDPNHRDRIAFCRICSGRFERNKFYHHVRLDKKLRFSDRKSTRLNSSHIQKSRMPSSA